LDTPSYSVQGNTNVMNGVEGGCGYLFKGVNPTFTSRDKNSRRISLRVV